MPPPPSRVSGPEQLLAGLTEPGALTLRQGSPPVRPAARPTRWGAELLAGVSVAGVLLPEAVAYAAIAGVEPMHALLAALAGLCIYPILGTSRFAVVSPTSSAAAVFGSAVVMGGPAMGYALVGLTFTSCTYSCINGYFHNISLGGHKTDDFRPVGAAL